jgi:hypothetical protein
MDLNEALAIAWIVLSFTTCALMAIVTGVELHCERRKRALERDVLELTGDIEAYRLGCAHWELHVLGLMRRGKSAGARA